MSSDLQIVVCGSTDSIESTTLCLPIPHQTLFDLNNLKNYIIAHSTSYSFILLLLDLNDQNSNSLLEEIRQQHNLFAIFICGKSVYNLADNQINVFHITKRLITNRITSKVIQFFELASRKLFELNCIGPAHILKQKANDLKRYHTTNGKIKGCHVLIVPLNTKDDNLYDYQQRVIELCTDLCVDFEPTVCTLYDYIPSDEMFQGSHADGYEQKEIICDFIKKTSSIRMYLVGNEVSIPNSSSKWLLEHESDINLAGEYDTKYTLVENEPLGETIKQILSYGFGCSRQVTIATLRRLDWIKNDIDFFYALERTNITHKAREMVADIAFCQQTMSSDENSFVYSSSLHMIGQAENGSTEQIEGANEGIDNTIQLDYMQPS